MQLKGGNLKNSYGEVNGTTPYTDYSEILHTSFQTHLRLATLHGYHILNPYKMATATAVDRMTSLSPMYSASVDVYTDL